MLVSWIKKQIIGSYIVCLYNLVMQNLKIAVSSVFNCSYSQSSEIMESWMRHIQQYCIVCLSTKAWQIWRQTYFPSIAMPQLQYAVWLT